MIRDDIIRMAREAGADCEFAVHIPAWDMSTWEFMERFAALVAAAEREACIDIVAMNGGSVEIEAAIRARGEKK